MTRRMLGSLAVAAALLLGPTVPASAGHGGYDYREGDCENGGCGQRDEEYGDNSCKYVCPDFKDSPVHDAFNFSPFVCMPGATCYEDGGKRQREGGQGQRPAAAVEPPNPACLVPVPFHCDPKPH